MLVPGVQELIFDLVPVMRASEVDQYLDLLFLLPSLLRYQNLRPPSTHHRPFSLSVPCIYQMPLFSYPVNAASS